MIRNDVDVLIVDDDAPMREVVSTALSVEGYRTVAADGVDALARLREGLRPHLILLDFRMPDIDGSTFLRAQRELPGVANTPVIVLSGDRNTAQEASALGVAAWLMKPVELGDLLGAVHRYC